MVGWGWYYLSTVLDDYSRYIIAWLLRTSMQAGDVTETLDLARARTGVDRVQVVHRPRLLSDNGPAYLSGELATYLATHGMAHTRGAPYHPMTQGKIERDHRSLKNIVKLEKYYRSADVDRAGSLAGRWNASARHDRSVPHIAAGGDDPGHPRGGRREPRGGLVGPPGVLLYGLIPYLLLVGIPRLIGKGWAVWTRHGS